MSHDATKNLNDVMRKYDRESNTRAWEGKPKIAVQAYLAAFAIFEVYVTLFGTMLDEVRLTSFVGGLLIAGFLIFPSHKHEFRVNYVPWYDWVIMRSARYRSSISASTPTPSCSSSRRSRRTRSYSA